jgi:ADP-ribose pyrophosphatase YjhB (NUDIX family)
MVNPEGYMEIPLPKTDMTGLRNQNFSRINGNTLEGVQQDSSAEAAAVREVHEELGLTIHPSDLILLFSTGGEEENSIVSTQTLVYGVFIKDAPKLMVVDQEFANDDITRPSWHKLNQIYQKDNQFFVPNSDLPIRRVAAIHLAIRALIQNPEELCKPFLDLSANQNFEAIVGTQRKVSLSRTLK